MQVHDYNKTMQISNPILSSYLSGTINRSQQVDRLPVRPFSTQPEPIEGVLVDDKKQQENTRQAELIPPVAEAQKSRKISTDSTSEIILIQQKKQLQFDDSSENKPSYPFSHRRSFEGLAGSSLVIQKYLNNEPPALAQADSRQRNVDLFI